MKRLKSRFDELQHYFQRHPKWLEQGRIEEMNENFCRWRWFTCERRLLKSL